VRQRDRRPQVQPPEANRVVTPPVERSWITVSLKERDRWPALAPAGALGLVAAGLMAGLGLPPVDLHGPLHRWWSVMDPLCGGTRSVRLAAMGDLAAAWRYNPLGPILVTGAALAVLRWCIGVATHRWLGLNLVGRRPVRAARLVVTLLVGLLAVRQQLNVELLR
jgi:hypothetical protein